MSYQQAEPLSRQATILIGLTVVGFMAFGLALSFYKNVLFEQTLTGIAQSNDNLRIQIEEGRKDLEYFRSAQFKDKYAKENLNRMNPGEKVLIIHEADVSPDTGSPELIEERREAAYLEMLRQMPVIEHWQLYLFHRTRAEELKQSFFNG